MSIAAFTSRLPLPTIIRRYKSGLPQVFQKSEFKVLHPTSDLYQVGGYKVARDRLGDIVRYFQSPGQYISGGVKPPKGVILSGPPGTGKTFMAEATAGHAGVPLIQLSASELYSKWVGETEVRLRNLFQQARQIAPCVVCIDEFDSIGNHRITGDYDSTNAVYINAHVNQLLALLSEEHKGVVLIATTNHFKALDPAIVRQGRFDKHIAIGLPDKGERCEILGLHTQKMRLHPTLALKDLADLTEGFSGAKLAGWVNEAALIALRSKSDCIDMGHLDEARTIISEGIGKPIENIRQKQVTAAHEAGHAVVGFVLGFRVFKISIYETQSKRGFVELYPHDYNLPKEQMLNKICLFLAGRAAEIVLGQVTVGASSDLRNAFYLAKVMVFNEGMGSTLVGTKGEVSDILQKQMARAIQYILEAQDTWLRLTDALMEHNELLESEFLSVLANKPITKSRKHASELTLELPPKTIRKKRT